LPLIPPAEFEIGQTLTLEDSNAVVRWVGSLPDRDGLWLGLELSTGGMHNGVYHGVRYFSCPPRRGVFRPVDKVRASLERKSGGFNYQQFSERAEGEPILRNEVKVNIRENKKNKNRLNEWSFDNNTLTLYTDTLEIIHRQGPCCCCFCDIFQAITISRVDLEHVTSFVSFKSPFNPYILLLMLSFCFGLGYYLRSVDILSQQWQTWLIPGVFLLLYLLWAALCRPMELSIGVKGQINPLCFLFTSHGDSVNLEIEAAVRSQQRVLLEQREDARFQRFGIGAAHV